MPRPTASHPPTVSHREPVSHRAPGPARLFAGPRRPIRVAGIERLADPLARLVIDWPSEDDMDGGASDIAVDDRAGSITLDSRTPGARPLVFSDPTDAANALAGALIGAYVAQDACLISLHAACAVIDGRAVAMMGPSGAGKSSLAIHLAHAGHRFVCDDRIVLRVPAENAAPEAVALGLAAKLRLPLPAETGDEHAAFIARREAHAGDGIVHLRLDADERMEFGVAAPLAAIVLLDRRAGGPVQLVPVPRADLARAVLAD
ncbi:MAG: hypothetical protein ACTSXZ_07130, partial [Alphaproteobacteria bacterium]